MSTITTTATTPRFTETVMETTDSRILAQQGSYILRHLLPRDVAGYGRVHDRSFANSMGRLFFPHGRTPADEEHTRASILRSLKRDKHMTRLVCIDTSAAPLDSDLIGLSGPEAEAVRAEGRLAAYSAWKIYPRDRTEEEMAAEAAGSEEDGLPPSMNAEAVAAFQDVVQGCKAKYLGKKAHVLLHILATDPDYHRRGIGAMNLAWGLAEADRLGLPAYLEGTEDGQELYRRWGFEDRELMPFDATKYGLDRRMDLLIQIRPRKSERGWAGLRPGPV